MYIHRPEERPRVFLALVKNFSDFIGAGRGAHPVEDAREKDSAPRILSSLLSPFRYEIRTIRAVKATRQRYRVSCAFSLSLSLLCARTSFEGSSLNVG